MSRDDNFSARLGGKPSEVYLEHLRKPEYEMMVEHFFDPLVVCNRAQTIMLYENDLLDSEEVTTLLESIAVIEERGAEDFRDAGRFEDPYLQMEEFIISRSGEPIGGKLHTGRSRNDLYAAAVRMATREYLLEIVGAVLDLRRSVLDHAGESEGIVMPAFTHSQPAQPITLAHYLLAFDHLLERDVERLRRSFEATNRSPLGAAALGGTGFNIDRERLAELAGFDGICYNTYDAVASMDYVPEATSSVAQLMTSVSRVSTDLIQWATYEFSFIELDDSFATVSSIMPQKKNPVVLEKTRTAASDTIGAAGRSLTHLKAAPFGDVREVAKYAFLPLFQTADDVVRSLRLLTGVIETMEINEEQMLEDARTSFCTMTELADTLVRECDLTFRQAHHVVAALVKIAHDSGKTADEITGEELDRVASEVLDRPVGLTADELAAALDPETNVTRRDVLGGTAPECNHKDKDRQTATLADQRSWHTDRRSDLKEAADLRRDRHDSLT